MWPTQAQAPNPNLSPNYFLWFFLSFYFLFYKCLRATFGTESRLMTHEKPKLKLGFKIGLKLEFVCFFPFVSASKLVSAPRAIQWCMTNLNSSLNLKSNPRLGLSFFLWYIYCKCLWVIDLGVESSLTLHDKPKLKFGSKLDLSLSLGFFFFFGFFFFLQVLPSHSWHQ